MRLWVCLVETSQPKRSLERITVLSVVHVRLPMLKMSSKHFLRGLFVVYSACNLVLRAGAR